MIFKCKYVAFFLLMRINVSVRIRAITALTAWIKTIPVTHFSLKRVVGVKRIKSYIFLINYIADKAVNSASKAAYLSLLIKYGISAIQRFDKAIDLRMLVIKNPEYKKFKTIMKFDLEEYFYWYKSFEILDKEEFSKRPISRSNEN